MRINHKLVKKYLKELKLCLPGYQSSKKTYLSFMENEINNYICSAEHFTYDDLVKMFGEPKDLAANYLSECNSEELRKALRFSKNIKFALLSIIAFAFIGLGVSSLFFHLSCKAADDSYNTRKIIETKTTQEEN